MGEKSYRTKQRDSIYAYFAAHPDACLSARDIIENPEIAVGEATVFRCLSHLTAEGKIKKYVGAGGGALYQVNHAEECNSHFHLKCLICGEIIHLDCSVMQGVEEKIAASHDFVVDVSRTVIYGFCHACREAGLVDPVRLREAKDSARGCQPERCGQLNCRHNHKADSKGGQKAGRAAGKEKK